MPLADTEPEEKPVLWRTREPRREVGRSPAHSLTNSMAPAGHGPCACSPNPTDPTRGHSAAQTLTSLLAQSSRAKKLKVSVCSSPARLLCLLRF